MREGLSSPHPPNASLGVIPSPPSSSYSLQSRRYWGTFQTQQHPSAPAVQTLCQAGCLQALGAWICTWACVCLLTSSAVPTQTHCWPRCLLCAAHSVTEVQLPASHTTFSVHFATVPVSSLCIAPSQNRYNLFVSPVNSHLSR